MRQYFHQEPEAEPVSKLRRPPPAAVLASRRRVLRGALGAAIGLPFLESLPALPARALAAASVLATFPTRFVVMFSPSGTVPSAWTPVGTENQFTLSPILSPLANHQADIVVIGGVSQRGGGGDGHQNGMAGMLTGQLLNPGPFAGVGSAPAGWAAGPSVDQRVASVLGTTTQLRSLELGVQVGAADDYARMCYRDADQPLPPVEDPSQAYASIFTDLHTDPNLLARLRMRNQSILDTLGAQYARTASRLAAADRARLDQHLTAVRELERRLTTPFAPPPGGVCRDPAPPVGATGANDEFAAIGALQIDLLVMALACDLTRVASLQWSRALSPTRFTWLPVPIAEGHHELSHRGDDDAAAVDKLTRINQWYATQLANLMAKLKAVPEGEGTLLDHTLILWCNELAKGNTHSRVGAPYVLAGRAGGALRTGRFLAFAGDVPHNNLLLAILKMMGLPDVTFGKPDWCTGPLPGLLG